MWAQIFETPWLFSLTPFVTVTGILCLMGGAYFVYLAANIWRIVRTVRKQRCQ